MSLNLLKYNRDYLEVGVTEVWDLIICDQLIHT